MPSAKNKIKVAEENTPLPKSAKQFLDHYMTQSNTLLVPFDSRSLVTQEPKLSELQPSTKVVPLLPERAVSAESDSQSLCAQVNQGASDLEPRSETRHRVIGSRRQMEKG